MFNNFLLIKNIYLYVRIQSMYCLVSSARLYENDRITYHFESYIHYHVYTYDNVYIRAGWDHEI